VFRWDDRGVGGSEGDYLAASADLLVGDVAEAMSAIEQETGFRVHVLIGHSQGTLVGAAVAAEHHAKVSGLILLAGMGVRGRDGLLDQHARICAAEGYSDEDVRSSLIQKAALFDMLLEAHAKLEAGAPSSGVLQDLELELQTAFLGDLALADVSKGEREELSEVVEDLLEWEWRYLSLASRAETSRKLRVPSSRARATRIRKSTRDRISRR